MNNLGNGSTYLYVIGTTSVILDHNLESILDDVSDEIEDQTGD
jgi:hypothetical protein